VHLKNAKSLIAAATEAKEATEEFQDRGFVFKRESELGFPLRSVLFTCNYQRLNFYL
jgi:hypothetical protein